MVITSKQNATIQQIVALQSKKGRKEYQQYFIEGKKQVQEAIKFSMPIEKLVISENFHEKADLIQRIKQYNDAKIIEVTDSLFERISMNKTPQGLLAVLKMPDTKVQKPQNKAILLDGVSDCGNLGTILRSANAFGIHDIYLKNCADPFSPKTVQASMSGIFFVRLHIGNFTEIVESLKGIPWITADLHGKNLYDYSFPKECCLVLGNEGNGISQEVKDYCSESVTIPMQEQAESLNVAVAASILMYSMQK